MVNTVFAGFFLVQGHTRGNGLLGRDRVCLVGFKFRAELGVGSRV